MNDGHYSPRFLLLVQYIFLYDKRVKASKSQAKLKSFQEIPRYLQFNNLDEKATV